MTDITSPIEAFIASCNDKRKGNPEEFSIIGEFSKLDLNAQNLIIESINNYKLKQVTQEDKYSLIDEFYRPLKALMIGKNALKGKVARKA